MRILIADDHKMMRDGLRSLLEREHFEVVGEAANGREATVLAKELHPDLVVMDISMPDLNGIDATRHIVGESHGTKVIGLSMNSDRRYVMAMFNAGAVGYLLKSSASDELIHAVRAVSSGLKYVSPSVASVVVDSTFAPPSKDGTERKLSGREREVLQQLSEGKSSKEIAAHLSLAVPTVETHRRQIMAKLNLHTIAELTKYAIREGITSVD